MNDISDRSSGPGVRNFFRERRFEYHILNAPVLKCGEHILCLIARIHARLKIFIPRWTKGLCQVVIEWKVWVDKNGLIRPYVLLNIIDDCVLLWCEDRSAMGSNLIRCANGSYQQRHCEQHEGG